MLASCVLPLLLTRQIDPHPHPAACNRTGSSAAFSLLGPPTSHHCALLGQSSPAAVGGLYFSEVNRIRSVRGGTVVLHTVEYLSLFIQEEEGKLSGTSSITSHIKASPDCRVPLTYNTSWLDPSFIFISLSYTTRPRTKIISTKHFLEHLGTVSS